MPEWAWVTIDTSLGVALGFLWGSYMRGRRELKYMERCARLAERARAAQEAGLASQTGVDSLETTRAKDR
jgi:hypothetical protein